jgi:hypothetical protein
MESYLFKFLLIILSIIEYKSREIVDSPANIKNKWIRQCVAQWTDYSGKMDAPWHGFFVCLSTVFWLENALSRRLWTDGQQFRDR